MRMMGKTMSTHLIFILKPLIAHLQTSKTLQRDGGAVREAANELLIITVY